MTNDLWVKVLMFSGGLVSLLGTFIAALPSVPPDTKVLAAALVTLAVGVVDLALYVFFQVQKPIKKAYDRGAQDQREADDIL